MLFLGGPPLRGAAGRNLFLEELPLRGAARLKEGEGSLVSGGTAAAARGCREEPVSGELPLRGAARLKEGGACFWKSSRCADCAELLN